MNKNNKKESLLNRLFRAPLLLTGVRIFNLAVLAIMVYFAYNYHGINGINVADPLMYTNIATFLFWVFWLMIVVISVIFFGRIWCTICPLGWLHGIFSMNFLKRPYPKSLKNNTLLIIFTFLALFSAVALKAHRFPDLTAKIILVFILIVIALGIIFKKRVFCRYLCPIGGMLALYSRVGPVELFVKDKNVCEKCATKQCVNGEKKWYKLTLGKLIMMYGADKDGCPVELTPNSLADMSDCNLCLNCFTVCPNRNLNVRYRKGSDDIAPREPMIGNALFATVLFGLISINFFKVYPVLKNAINRPADILFSSIGSFSAPTLELLYALYGTVFLPIFFILLVSYVTKTVSGARIDRVADVNKEVSDLKRKGSVPDKISFSSYFTAVAFSTAPIVLGAHIVLALVKLNTKLGYFPYIFLDPTGVKSYLSFNVFNIYEQPGVIVPLPILKWIIAAVVIAGYVFSLVAAKKITATQMKAGGKIGERGFIVLSAALLIIAGAYLMTVYNWLFIMGR